MAWSRFSSRDPISSTLHSEIYRLRWSFESYAGPPTVPLWTRTAVFLLGLFFLLYLMSQGPQYLGLVNPTTIFP